MTHRLLALGLAAAFALAHAPAAAAQTEFTRAFARPAAAAATPPADWSAVQALSAGEKIVVRTKDGDRLTGRFDSASDLLINFTDGRRRVSLTRESIRLVQLDRGNSRGRGALMGAAIGAAAGFAVGAVLYFPFRDDMVASTVPATTALGAGIGAGIGVSTGKGKKNVTVYEAP
ncbi:MAG TPA: hypothetical protein VF659_18095 [Pyrinomonadaceae bacterium]